MANFLTFDEIVAAVGREVKDFDQAQNTMIGEMVNQVYFSEVLNCDELYPLYWMRVYLDSWKAKAPKNIEAITQADPGQITSTAHGFTDVDLVSVHNIGGMTELNDIWLRVDAAAANTFEILDADSANVDTTLYTAYTSGGTIHHRGFFLAATVLLQRFISMNIVDEGLIEPITIDELNESQSLLNDNTGRPTRYQLIKVFSTAGAEANAIMWYPGSDQAYGPIQVWYELQPLKLEAGDVPLLPPAFHYVLVAGTVMRLIDNSGFQIENAMVWPGIYQQMIRNLKTFNRKFYDDATRTQRYPTYLL